MKALKDLNVDEDIINRNMFSSSSNVNLNSANQLENIYSVEKSLAKNLNLNGLFSFICLVIN